MGRIVVSVTKKRQAAEAFSSDGVGVEYHSDEIEIADSADFQNRVAGLLAECQQAVDAELARIAQPSQRAADTERSNFWTGNGGNGNDDRSHQRADSGHRIGGNGNGGEAISNKQARYLTQLLARKGISQQDQISAFLQQSLGVSATTIYDLDKATASQAIESLKANQGGDRA